MDDLINSRENSGLYTHIQEKKHEKEANRLDLNMTVSGMYYENNTTKGHHRNNIIH